MPAELAEAMFVVQTCERFRTLPEVGGLLDQPVWFFTALNIVAGAGVTPLVDDDDPLAGIPMVTL